MVKVQFLSTPSSQRATPKPQRHTAGTVDFYPRPLRRGRLPRGKITSSAYKFLSTPSSQRATPHGSRTRPPSLISIHALFAEGDPCNAADRQERLISIHALFAEGDHDPRRLSDPSDRFLSTPSSQRATVFPEIERWMQEFLSTPSSQRATSKIILKYSDFRISIHALFAEGDFMVQSKIDALQAISIHALFAEGDVPFDTPDLLLLPFLSTPSSQRATETVNRNTLRRKFLSTPSSQRATRFVCPFVVLLRRISIHALFAEGDYADTASCTILFYFYPRPLRRGRRHRQGGCCP